MIQATGTLPRSPRASPLPRPTHRHDLSENRERDLRRRLGTDLETDRRVDTLEGARVGPLGHELLADATHSAPAADHAQRCQRKIEGDPQAPSVEPMPSGHQDDVPILARREASQSLTRIADDDARRPGETPWMGEALAVLENDHAEADRRTQAAKRCAHMPRADYHQLGGLAHDLEKDLVVPRWTRDQARAQQTIDRVVPKSSQ